MREGDLLEETMRVASYIKSVVMPALGVAEDDFNKALVDEENQKLLRSFINDAHAPVLNVMSRPHGSSHETIGLSQKTSFAGTGVQSVLFRKLGSSISEAASISSQLKFFSFADADPTDQLFDVVIHAVSPMIESISVEMEGEEVEPEDDVREVFNKVNSLNHTLKRSVQSSRQDVDITVHEAILPKIKMVCDREMDEDDFLQDEDNVVRLSANVQQWNVDLSKLIKISEEDHCKDTAAAEINFWVSIGKTLRKVNDQKNMREVHKSLELLRRAKKPSTQASVARHNIHSFNSTRLAGIGFMVMLDVFKTTCLKVEERMDRVDDPRIGFCAVMKDFPLAKLETSLKLKDVTEAIQLMFDKLNKARNIKDLRVNRMVSFVAKIGVDVSSAIGRQLQGLLKMDFKDFERHLKAQRMIGNGLGAPIRGITRVSEEEGTFVVWESHCDKFVKMLMDTDADKKDQEKVFEDYLRSVQNERGAKKTRMDFQHARKHEILKQLTLPLQSRIVEIYHFRKDHSILWSALSDSASDDMDADEARQLLNVKFEDILQNPVILECSTEGTERWKRLQKEYFKQAEASERQITQILKGCLSKAVTARKMFQVLRKFEPLLHRPMVSDAVKEFRDPLFINVLEDLTQLGHKLEPFTESDVERMSKLRDYPPRAASRMWFKQIQNQLTLVTEKLETIFGPNWSQLEQGKRVGSKCAKYHKELNKLCGAGVQDKDVDIVDVHGEIFLDAQEWIFNLLEEFYKLNKVLAVEQVGGKKLRLCITASKDTFEIIKEVRNFKYQHFEKETHGIKAKAEAMLGISTYARMLDQALFVYERTTARGVPKRMQSLTDVVVKDIQKRIKEIESHGWLATSGVTKMEAKTEEVILNLYGQVMKLEKLNDELNTLADDIHGALAEMESCTLSFENVRSPISRLQSMVNRIGDYKIVASMMAGWVGKLNNEVGLIVNTRVKQVVQQWASALPHATHKSSVPGSLICLQETITVKLDHGKIKMDPPLEAVQSLWVAHLHSVIRSFSQGLPCLLDPFAAVQADQDFTALLNKRDAVSLKGAYRAVLNVVQQAEKQISFWTAKQSLWEIEEDTIVAVVGDNVSAWSQLVVDVAASYEQLDQKEPSIVIGPLVIDTKLLLARCKRRTLQWREVLLRRMAERVKSHVIEQTETIGTLRAKIEDRSLNRGSQEAIQLYVDLQKARIQRDKFAEDLASVESANAVLENLDFRFPADWIGVAHARGAVESLGKLITSKEEQFRGQLVNFQQTIDEEISKFNSDVRTLIDDWRVDKPIEMSSAMEALQGIASFERRIQIIRAESKRLDFYDAVLNVSGKCGDDFVKNTQQEMEELKRVWGHLRRISDGLYDIGDVAWKETNPKEIREKLEGLLEDMERLPNKVCQYKAWTNQNHRILRLIDVNKVLVELDSEMIKPKHWAQLKEVLGGRWVNSNDLLLQDLWDTDLMGNEQVVIGILQKAAGEGALELFLRDIKEFWQVYTVNMIMYQQKCWLMKGWDELTEALTKDISSLEDMSKSAYYKVFEEEANLWLEHLTQAQDHFCLWSESERNRDIANPS